MKNPIWEREADIAKVDLEMLQEDLEQEWNNGKEIRSEEGRQSENAGGQVGSVDGGDPIDQRNPQPDAGANP